VALFGNRVFADIVKDLEMTSSSEGKGHQGLSAASRSRRKAWSTFSESPEGTHPA